MEAAARRARYYWCPHGENWSAHIHTLFDSRKKSSGKVNNKGPKVKEKFESQLPLQETQIKGLQNTQRAESH